MIIVDLENVGGGAALDVTVTAVDTTSGYGEPLRVQEVKIPALGVGKPTPHALYVHGRTGSHFVPEAFRVSGTYGDLSGSGTEYPIIDPRPFST